MSDLIERSARQLIDNPPTEGLSPSGIRQRAAARRQRRSAIGGIGCVAVAVVGLGLIANYRGSPDAASAPTETLPAVEPSSSTPDQESDLAAVQALFDLAPYDDVTDAMLSRVSQELMRRCMSEQGFEYTPILPGVRDVSDVLTILPTLPTSSQISQLGYAAFADPQTTDTSDADAAMEANDAKAEQDVAFKEALFGIEPDNGGCNAATLAATGSFGTGNASQIYSSLVPAVSAALRPPISTDPQLVGAIGEWKDCLKSAGFTPPLTLFPTLNTSTKVTDAVPDDEIAMATADVECRRSSMVRDQYIRVYGAAAKQFFHNNATRVAELRSAETVEAIAIRQQVADLDVLQDD